MPVTLPPGASLDSTRPPSGVVGDGGPHDGDLGGGAGDRLGGRCGDGEDQVVTVVHELARDGLAGGLVVLGVLLVNLGVDARLFDGSHEALVGLVERAVLGELQHADLVGVLGGGAAAWDGFAVIATARKRTRGKKARSEGDKVPARDTQHGDNSVSLFRAPAKMPATPCLIRRFTV